MERTVSYGSYDFNYTLYEDGKDPMKGKQYIGNTYSVVINEEEGISGGVFEDIPYILGTITGREIQPQQGIRSGKGLVCFTAFDAKLEMLIGHRVFQRPLIEIAQHIKELKTFAKSCVCIEAFENAARPLLQELENYIALKDSDAKTRVRLTRKLESLYKSASEKIHRNQKEQEYRDAIHTNLEVRKIKEADIPDVERLINDFLIKTLKRGRILFNPDFVKNHLKNTLVGCLNDRVVATLIFRRDGKSETDARTIIRLGFHSDYPHTILSTAFFAHILSQNPDLSLNILLNSRSIRTEYFQAMGFRPIRDSRGKTLKTEHGESVYNLPSTHNDHAHVSLKRREAVPA